MGLDHVRAVAAFTVFTWHFNHINNNNLSGPETFPLSFLAEGHIGVAMFMTLSGYLFAKLLDGQKIRYFPFLWNRVIRLFPLLIFVFILHGIIAIDPSDAFRYLINLTAGLIYPSWPNGGWSIAVELHFYAILPILLTISSRNPKFILLSILASILARTGWWLHEGTVQQYAYWTIMGGLDQFVLGIFAFKMRDMIVGRHIFAFFVAVILTSYITYFDFIGGFYRNQEYPSPSPIWIIHPTVLAVGFSFLIAWYDTSFSMQNTGFSGVAAKIGACSYSIYLIHFFFVFRASRWIDENIIELSTFPLILLFSAASFSCLVPIAYLSYRFIELPPLRFRTPYKIPTAAAVLKDI